MDSNNRLNKLNYNNNNGSDLSNKSLTNRNAESNYLKTLNSNNQRKYFIQKKIRQIILIKKKLAQIVFKKNSLKKEIVFQKIIVRIMIHHYIKKKNQGKI